MTKAAASLLTVLAFAVVFIAGAMGEAKASSYQVVHQGIAGTQGVLAADAPGNLYGEAAPGSGDTDGGSVFELTVASGYARKRVLYVFGNGGVADGNNPMGGVTLTAHNVILGTTNAGGVDGDGTVFNLGTPRKVVFTADHAFSGSAAPPRDGAAPASGLTLGPANHYYGTTTAGGNTAQYGTLFSVTGSATDPKYRLLHVFRKNGDGAYPGTGRLAVDGQGRLYGATSFGGASNGGAVFTQQNTDGGWVEQVIYSFGGGLGNVGQPRGNVVLDAQGNVYGCAADGAYGRGGLYRLNAPAQAGEAWQETILYNFGAQPDDPSYGGMCNLALDQATGLIVGTSHNGGSHAMGTIFTLTPPVSPHTTWTEAVAHNFAGGSDGAYPISPPLQLGATYYGGNSTNGAIYAYTP